MECYIEGHGCFDPTGSTSIAIANTQMRIGEIAIVGPGLESNRKFVKAVCDEVILETEQLIFGRLRINEQLVLHLYGLRLLSNQLNPSWDLLSKKLLGYVVLFNWNHSESLAAVKPFVDELSDRYRIPMVVAAAVQNTNDALPERLLNVEFDLAKNSQFTFCKLTEPASVKNVLAALVNQVIESYY